MNSNTRRLSAATAAAVAALIGLAACDGARSESVVTHDVTAVPTATATQRPATTSVESRRVTPTPTTVKRTATAPTSSVATQRPVITEQTRPTPTIVAPVTVPTKAPEPRVPVRSMTPAPTGTTTKPAPAKATPKVAPTRTGVAQKTAPVKSKPVVVTPKSKPAPVKSKPVVATPRPKPAPSRDYCPNGDYTSSRYDGRCGTAPVVSKPKPQSPKPPTSAPARAWVTGCTQNSSGVTTLSYAYSNPAGGSATVVLTLGGITRTHAVSGSSGAGRIYGPVEPVCSVSIR